METREKPSYFQGPNLKSKQNQFFNPSFNFIFNDYALINFEASQSQWLGTLNLCGYYPSCSKNDLMLILILVFSK